MLLIGALAPAALMLSGLIRFADLLRLAPASETSLGWYAVSFAVLYVYLLPAVMLYLALAVCFGWRRNGKGLAVSLLTVFLLAACWMVFADWVWGDGRIHWRLVSAAALLAAMAAVPAWFCLPGRSAASED
ncbi:MAG: hypothetical protein Q4A62_05240 [Eikenella sp.]|nr:hypothetical protein [Eikenella sp.]